MPYSWTALPDDTTELRLWPHNALPARGFAATVLGFYGLATIPLYGLLGTVLFWGILPFLLLVLAALAYALRRNAADRQILEVLTVSPETTSLTRSEPRQSPRDWDANTYWVKVTKHTEGGPVPHYVTLSGKGREVEIGAFLSEEERITLYSELSDRLSQARKAGQ